MLSRAIKDKVEYKYGSTVRYPVECDALAEEISKATGRSISSSTIKRLWGFIEGATAARSYTLDTVAEYCDFSCFEDLVSSFDPEKTEQKPEPVKILASEIGIDQVVLVGFVGDQSVQLQRHCENTFRVASSSHPQLVEGQRIHFNSIEVGYPLFIRCLDNDSSSTLTLGSVSGVTSLHVQPRKGS